VTGKAQREVIMLGDAALGAGTADTGAHEVIPIATGKAIRRAAAAGEAVREGEPVRERRPTAAAIPRVDGSGPNKATLWGRPMNGFGTMACTEEAGETLKLPCKLP